MPAFEVYLVFLYYLGCFDFAYFGLAGSAGYSDSVDSDFAGSVGYSDSVGFVDFAGLDYSDYSGYSGSADFADSVDSGCRRAGAFLVPRVVSRDLALFFEVLGRSLQIFLKAYPFLLPPQISPIRRL